MTLVRVGSNKKYSDGWTSAFSKKGSAPKTAAKKAPSPKKKKSKK